MGTEKKSDESDVTVEDILAKLGPFGKFNILTYTLILLPVFTAGMYSSVFNFEVLDLDYRCAVPECEEGSSAINFTIPRNEDGKLSKCTRYAPVNITNSTIFCFPQHFDTSVQVECDSYVYLEDYSIVKEFDLACQDWKRSLVGTVHNAGFFVSIPLTGVISDRFGRKLAVVFSCVTNGIFGLIRALSVDYYMFVIFEFLEPAFGAGIYTACFVLALELVGPKGRVLVSLLFNTMFILGGVTVTLLSWKLQNWRTLLFIIYTPAVFAISYLWLLSESFRWYFSKGRYADGLSVLYRMEKINNVRIPAEHYDHIEKKAIQQRDERKLETAKSNQSSFQEMFTSFIIWKRLIICSFLWIASTLVYYGLSINAIELSGNIFMNYIVVIVIEAPANVCKLIFLDRYGRKKVIAIAYGCAAVILINYGFVPAGNWSMAVYLGGKFFITLAYNALYVFAAEVFPTNYRTTLLALCSTIGRIGSTVAPLTPLLTKFYEYLPTTLFGIMSALSAVLVLTLPETNNQKLPDSLREAEDQGKSSEEQSKRAEDRDRSTEEGVKDDTIRNVYKTRL